MLRELQVQFGKNIPATYKAATAMVTGMGVVIDGDEVKFPAEATAKDIFVVDKERIANGANVGYVQVSDYFADFVNIGADELVKIHAYHAPERFATDQFANGVDEESTYLAVGTDGKWAESESATKYMYDGEYSDAGHKLIVVRVLEG